MNDYPIIPGRGLVSQRATKLRLDYLKDRGIIVDKIEKHSLQFHDIRNKIESFIGSVEVPIGLLGPLRFNENDSSELVYAAAATLEGALIASINRGSKAISLSGGFLAEFIHQKMTRAPLFVLKNDEEAIQFEGWIVENFTQIKAIAEKYSNHAQLIEINPIRINNAVHLKFVYTTCDASGQNMTTTCTWNAMNWIVKKYQEDTGITVDDYVIEGNAASDKKVSKYVFEGGRGICVKATCFLQEEVIQKILRTTSEKLVLFFNHSVEMAKQEGMIGYNINVANAIAAIFVATGQDIASVHESSLGILSVEKKEGGIQLSLKLPSLVIGSIGGGTAIPMQKEALELMGCYGKGKVERLAKLIAGFALSLEISTFSAVVSGEFAKAHEKLGRNKPINYLLPSEINLEFISHLLFSDEAKEALIAIQLEDSEIIENGILTTLTSRSNKKMIGFIPVALQFKDDKNQKLQQALLKSKGSDIDVINGLHLMASSIDTELADLIFQYRKHIEYRKCHHKELFIYETLHKGNLELTPKFYGKFIDEEREIYLLLIEYLAKKQLHIFDSENKPEVWNPNTVKAVIASAHVLSEFLHKSDQEGKLKFIPTFEIKKAFPLYQKLFFIVKKAYRNTLYSAYFGTIDTFFEDLDTSIKNLELPLRVIHNDFNPRNIAIRTNGKPVIYDWELSIRNLPHRDIIEFLSFVLPKNFTKTMLFFYLHYHHEIAGKEIPWSKWKLGYLRTLKEYILSRVLFYNAANILFELKFSNRVFETSMRIHGMLNDLK